jgi:hypothetical protein
VLHHHSFFYGNKLLKFNADFAGFMLEAYVCCYRCTTLGRRSFLSGWACAGMATSKEAITFTEYSQAISANGATRFYYENETAEL